MNQKRIGSAILDVLVLAAGGVLGKWYMDECDDIGTCSTSKWNDPNFNIINVASYNYTNYDIYGVYLLTPEKNSLDSAAHGYGNRATRHDEAQWEGPKSGAGLSWDYRWQTPKRFKVWWHRVVDRDLHKRSGPYPKDGGMFDPFDPYTSKQTRPGSAWCEGEITVTREPRRSLPSDLILHFYPDGRAQGDIEFEIHPATDADIAKRDAFPRLCGRACLKEVPNPFFGRKRPPPYVG
jgi:hypothetical protein